MLWRYFRAQVTHCELFETMQALLAAGYDFFDRYNQCASADFVCHWLQGKKSCLIVLSGSLAISDGNVRC
jgi:hypothetical protein